MAGATSHTKTGSYLPQETLDAIEKHRVVIKAPLATPVGGGIRSINVTLRQTFDLYACVRPVQWFEGVSSPVKNPEKVDMVIFRENTEDIYAGIEWAAGTPEVEKVISFLSDMGARKKIRFPECSAIGIKPVSMEGSKRLIRKAIQYAIDKAIIMPNQGLTDWPLERVPVTKGGFEKLRDAIGNHK